MSPLVLVLNLYFLILVVHEDGFSFIIAIFGLLSHKMIVSQLA